MCMSSVCVVIREVATKWQSLRERGEKNQVDRKSTLLICSAKTTLYIKY